MGLRIRSTSLRVALALAGLLLAGYAGALLWLLTQETRLLFRPGTTLGEARPPFAYEQVDLPRRDGLRQFAWIMPSEAPEPDTGAGGRSWLLFLHGNDSSIAGRFNIARYRDLRALGLHIIAPEYRGFGGLDGVPSEPAMVNDALAAFQYLTDTRRVAPSRIIVYGWSLGSAVAVHLGSQVRPGAVILEGAPASIAAIGQLQYPLFPIRLMMRNPFESIRRIDRVRAPLLFLHSPEDDIVPLSEGRRLYEAAPEPKRFVEVRGGHVHATEVDKPTFFGAIRSFLAEYDLIEK